MSRLPQISGEKLVKALGRDGWITVSQRGSHRNLKKGTLGSILKDAHITVEKLQELL